MKLYNSLTRQKEEFVPIRADKAIGVYTCGPTVYFYPHIGNWRTFVLGDIVIRSLKYFGYDVHYVMNITDVGHLTGDNLGDADTGEDRLEKAAKKENKTAWDIAKFYTQDFEENYSKLNLIFPTLDDGEKGFGVATHYIKEQIAMIKRIEEKGFTYITTDGVYFDIKAYEKAGNIYGRMSNIHKDNMQARVKPNLEKRGERDFALWKFSPKDTKRDMEWESPWGMGFPGWHIECSAISTKHLGDQFEIHIGGEDHKSTHHPGEIAQTEAATGKKPFVKYWLHGVFLQVDGGRMGKSLGNAYTLQDIESKGFDSLDLRYLYLTTHYRKKLNFTWDALKSAQTARRKLMDQVLAARTQTGRTTLSDEKNQKVQDFGNRFREALSDDFNMPQALAVVWETMKSNIPSEDKYDLAVSFDEVFGLRLAQSKESSIQNQVPDEVQELVGKRERLRAEKKFEEADKVRDEIGESGYVIRDSENGIILHKK